MMLDGEGDGGGAGGSGDGSDPPTGGAVVTFPGRNPAFFRAAVALPTLCPIKLGIKNACAGAACAASRLIFGAEMLLALAEGLCATT